MKYFNYYYYDRQQQALKMEVNKKEYYLLIDHYTKNAQLYNKEEIDKKRKGG